MKLPPYVEGNMGIDGEARPTEQNPIGKIMADALRGLKQGISSATRRPSYYHESTPSGDSPNYAAGDLLVGDADKLMEKISYGDRTYTGTGQTFRLDPAYMDLAGVAAIPATGIIKGVQATGKMMSKALRKALSKALRDKASMTGLGAGLGTVVGGPAGGVVGAAIPHLMSHTLKNPPKPVAQGRRGFLKTLGAGTAALAIPSLGAIALKGGAKTAVKTVGAQVAKTAVSWSSGVRAIAADTLSTLLAGTKLEGMARKLVKDLPDEAFTKLYKKMDDLHAKYGDEFDPHGYADRLNNSPDRISRVPGSNTPGEYDYQNTRKAMEWLREQSNANDIVERWQATGKWPKGKEDLMDSFDNQWWTETHIDAMTGELPHEVELMKYVNKNYPGAQELL